LFGLLGFIDVNRQAIPLNDASLPIAQRLTAKMAPAKLAVLVGLEPCSITLWWLIQVSESQENQAKQQNARRSAWVSDQGSWSDTNHVP